MGRKWRRAESRRQHKPHYHPAETADGGADPIDRLTWARVGRPMRWLRLGFGVTGEDMPLRQLRGERGGGRAG